MLCPKILICTTALVEINDISLIIYLRDTDLHWCESKYPIGYHWLAHTLRTDRLYFTEVPEINMQHPQNMHRISPWQMGLHSYKFITKRPRPPTQKKNSKPSQTADFSNQSIGKLCSVDKREMNVSWSRASW